jgi:hypothetical protein
MKCPHCLVEIRARTRLITIGSDVDASWAIEAYTCPNEDCGRLVLYLLAGDVLQGAGTPDKMGEVYERRLVNPRASGRPPVPPEVPEGIAEDYEEACTVLPFSAKASAALSRRCLQHLLRDVVHVKPGSLASEIQEVLDSRDLPVDMADALDVVRNVGNFAAHPAKSESTGEIVPVEPGEAEWNLDILESLFDFYCVRPAVLRAKREALDAKLKDAGRPPMKRSWPTDDE